MSCATSLRNAAKIGYKEVKLLEIQLQQHNNVLQKNLLFLASVKSSMLLLIIQSQMF